MSVFLHSGTVEDADKLAL